MSSLCFAQNFTRLPHNRSTARITPAVCSRMHMTASQTLRNISPVVSPGEWDLSLGSPAKINLFLRITGKRQDGFHDLASLFQAVSLRDTISFSVKTDQDENPHKDTLECDTAGIPTDSSNLIIKALDEFRKKTGSTKFFRIRLEKNIPHEAGLGGGSANAATALWAANVLNDRPCTTEQLANYGSAFGSDVSFFLSNGTAYCTGRGEILEELPPLPPQTLYIVKPKEGLSTKEVFSTLDLADCSDRDPKELLEEMQKDLISADFVNDLEPPSFRLMPKLKVLKEALYEEGFNVVMMSGSGTSLFCLGHPNSQDFMTAFPVKHDVEVFDVFFQGRKFPDMWYFEQPRP